MTNPIESVFTTVRNLTQKTRGLLEQENGTVHGLQADDVSKEKMAKA